jgi:hypothetical protein
MILSNIRRQVRRRVHGKAPSLLARRIYYLDFLDANIQPAMYCVGVSSGLTARALSTPRKDLVEYKAVNGA